MSGPGRSVLTAAELASLLTEARTRTVELVQDLTDPQLIGPRLDIVNPLLWEIGHIAWFQEHWILRHHAGRRPLRPDGDRLYDSVAIAHDTRWDLPLPSRRDTLAYLQGTLERAVAQLQSEAPSPELTYFSLLALFHEDMHAEAITYTRQTLAYPAPRLGGGAARPPELSAALVPAPESEPAALGDVSIPGGTYLLGAAADLPFVFDNEKWAHPVRVASFAIGRTAVSNAQFAAFVEDEGYRRAELWTPDGWAWRERIAAAHPVYWRRSARGWERRHFDRWVALERNDPVIHVNWFEADAYARWAGRRLPTEAEWELAASVEPGQEGDHFASPKRSFPWGRQAPDPRRVNMDGRTVGCLAVDALPEGDSAFGCRQMLGNVWEWTSTDFGPYPGFVADPYKEYSEPWFGDHKVLRGGSWTTRSRLIRNTWRNFYLPHRRDVWAGFRTCTSLPPTF